MVYARPQVKRSIMQLVHQWQYQWLELLFSVFACSFSFIVFVSLASPTSLISLFLHYFIFGVGLTHFPNAFIRYVEGLAVLPL
jgi:hypothetical protein